ncbi:hypothetical protein [Roseateles terrae]|uniref:Uncharacterized protein n=1 Tax=Roseateles terrae TaxID=431060 RepID=A0ABR6GPB6_9BURK|nr:hypothetical protein [Roseateles terrae]MBB3193946.1 hypothetical protein [Roseateles terrae]OWQ87823.1 hypothetical protein CDN98_06570 [Roseateles terrae]
MPATQTFGPEMGILDLIASVTGSLAWPGLIGFAIYTYRKPITRLLVGTSRMIRRMNSVKWGEFEMANRAFQEAKEAVQEKADVVEEQISEARPDEVASLVRELTELKLQAARIEAAQSALTTAKSVPSNEASGDDARQTSARQHNDLHAQTGRYIRTMVTALDGPQRVLGMAVEDLKLAITALLDDLDMGKAMDLQAAGLLDEEFRPTPRLFTRTRAIAQIMRSRQRSGSPAVDKQ